MFTNNMRLTGLSGIDTDSMVKQLMKAESLKYDKLQKQNTTLQWKQESYRGVASAMKTFQNSFLNLTNAAQNLRSASNFTAIKATATIGGKDAAGVKVTGTNLAAGGSHTLKVSQVAQTHIMKSANSVGKAVGAEDYSLKDGETNSFSFTLDGLTKSVSFTSDEVKAIREAGVGAGQVGSQADQDAAFQSKLNDKLKTAFGTDSGVAKASASISNGKITFEAGTGHTLNISTGSAKQLGFAHDEYSYKDQLTSTFAFKDCLGALKLGAGESGFNFEFTLDGVKSRVHLDENDFTAADYDTNGKLTANAFVDKLRNKKTETYDAGTDTWSASTDSLDDMGIGLTMNADNKFEFTIPNIAAGGEIGLKEGTFAPKTTFTISGDSANRLGFGNASSVNISNESVKRVYETLTTAPKGTTTLEKMFDTTAFDTIDGKARFTINGVNFEFEKTATMNDVVNKVNASAAGVKMALSELDGSVTLESKTQGQAGAIDASGAFVADGLKLTDKQAAQDTVFEYDGVLTTRNSSTFNIDGVTISLTNAVDKNTEITVGVAKDSTKAIEMVKTFVSEYNKLLASINDELTTMRPKKTGTRSYYEPLTDDEKDAMKDSDIAKWEGMAKTGLLYNDDLLNSLTRDLRSYMNMSVTLDDGSKISLYDLGVQTSSKTSEGGKLVLDPTKLEKAVENLGDKIADLFTKPSSKYSTLDRTNYTNRLRDEGIAERLNEIIDNYVGTRGKIAERAGIKGTLTEATNTMSKTLKTQGDKISAMLTYLQNKENYYYTMFSKMESSVTASNNQISYLQGMYGM